MCGEVEEMVHQAVDSLSDPDFDKAAALAEQDKRDRSLGRADRGKLPQDSGTASTRGD